MLLLLLSLLVNQQYHGTLRLDSFVTLKTPAFSSDIPER